MQLRLQPPPDTRLRASCSVETASNAAAKGCGERHAVLLSSSWGAVPALGPSLDPWYNGTSLNAECEDGRLS